MSLRIRLHLLSDRESHINLLKPGNHKSKSGMTKQNQELTARHSYNLMCFLILLSMLLFELILSIPENFRSNSIIYDLN